MKKFNLLLVALSLSIIGCSNKTNDDTNKTSESEVITWKCDNCGHDGNTGTYCVECGHKNGESVIESSSIVESSSIEESSSVEESSSIVEADEYNTLPNWKEESLDISTGADFLDVAVGRSFMTTKEYSLSYSYGTKINCDPSKDRVVCSNEKVFTAEKVGNGLIKVVAKHAGKAMLRIYDSNEIIRYCGVIVVEDAIPQEDMEEYLVYEAEYWVSVIGWGDSYNITFLEGGRYILSGKFSNEAFETVSGTYEYVGVSSTGLEYVYEFTDDDVDAVGFTGFDIAMTGTFMYLQEDGGTASILFPNDKVEDSQL